MPPRTTPEAATPPRFARCPAAWAEAAQAARSASRNIVWQNGHAVPITSAPVPASSSARSTFTRLPFSSPRNICPPPAPQQNDRSRVRRRLHHFAVRATDCAAPHKFPVTAQVAGIVKHHLLRAGAAGSFDPMPRQQFAVVLDLESRRRTPASPSPMVRTQCGQIEPSSRPWPPAVLRCSARPPAGTGSRCPAGAPDRPCTSLCAARRKSRPLPQHARQRQNNLAALRIVRAHAAQPEAILLRAVVNRKRVLLDEFLPLAGWRSPSELPLRSRFRKSLVPYSSSHLPVFTAPRRSPMMIGRC